jgi:hypothetical protein
MSDEAVSELLRGNRAFKPAESEGTNTLLEVDFGIGPPSEL